MSNKATRILKNPMNAGDIFLWTISIGCVVLAVVAAVLTK